MTIVLFVCMITLVVGLVTTASMLPIKPTLSPFELKRRKKTHQATALIDTLRYAHYEDVVSLQRIVQALLLVLFVLAAIGAFGWIVGSFVSLAVAICYGVVANIPFALGAGQRMYTRFELPILTFISQHQQNMYWLHSRQPNADLIKADSKHELEHLITSSNGILSDIEKKRLLSTIKFEDKIVHEIMTPKRLVKTVSKNEILGPLVLDDLHKTGHSRFPVVGDDSDQIIGILFLKDVRILDTKRRHTAKVETAMSTNVYYVRDDHTLSQALLGFLNMHHHLFVVVNQQAEMVGILTLEDTIGALIGHPPKDGFDGYDSVRAISLRLPE